MGLLSNGRFLALPANVRLGRKWLTVVIITAVKRFLILALERVIFVQMFFFVATKKPTHHNVLIFIIWKSTKAGNETKKGTLDEQYVILW